MTGKVVWTVLMSRHVDVAKVFYGATLGWSFEPFEATPNQCWTVRSAGGEVVAAFVDTSGDDFPDAPELWLPCIHVEHLDAEIAKAETLGATLLRPSADIPDFGRVAILRQPGGGIICWMTPDPTAA